MENSEIAKVLSEIATYLAMEDVPFKPRAYEKVAEVVGALDHSVASIYERGGNIALNKIPGVGASIAATIEELLTTGRSSEYEEFRKKIPVDLTDLLRVEGLGPKKIFLLFKKLGVRTLDDLRRVLHEGRVAQLAGFGEKSAANLERGLGFVTQSGSRLLLGDVLSLVRTIVLRLEKVRGVSRVAVAGSMRRWKETVGDADILVVAESSTEVMDVFVSMPEVHHVLAHGDTKSAIKLHNGFQVDVRVVPSESYGAALNYFTGSKDHNVALRQLAINQGLKLNEYGLFRGEKQIAGESEEEIYHALGLEYIEPELREMTGEIEASLRQAQGQRPGLPKLIGYGDLAGDLQVQTNWTDGSASIEEMAAAAYHAGLEYIAITDHTKRLAMARGLNDSRLIEQGKEIDLLNQKSKIKNQKFRILKGTECDILKDGSLDIADDVLKTLDVVGVSIHSLFNLSRAEQTERMCKAMRNPNVDIVFHPTGRLIQKRPAYDIDIDRIIVVAKETGTVLEANAFPARLDLKDEYIHRAMSAGVKISIDSDAHTPAHFSVLEFGIGQARRGWTTKDDVINAWPVERMLAFLKKA